MGQFFTTRNFPNSDVTDEGELPQDRVEGVPKLQDTKVWVARDPTQEPSSIEAVIVSVPSPDGKFNLLIDKGKKWLETPEMKRAEDALLALVKQWYKEGKISMVDCYVQVMMGVDAVIYQFVDGEKFIDYPDERIRKIKWE